MKRVRHTHKVTIWDCRTPQGQAMLDKFRADKDSNKYTEQELLEKYKDHCEIEEEWYMAQDDS